MPGGAVLNFAPYESEQKAAAAQKHTQDEAKLNQAAGAAAGSGGGTVFQDPYVATQTGTMSQKDLEAYLKTLTTGNLADPSSTLISSLAKSLSAMTPAESAAALKQLNAIPGSSGLAADISNSMAHGDSGTYTAPAQQNLYGFDPLNIAQYATQFLGPYLQASGEATQKAIANYAPEMQQALKGANPIVQAAFSSTIPLMQQAETLDNQAVTNATANAPYLNQIISGLTNAQTAAKAAQTAYAEAPYVAQAVQGTTTNGLSYSQMLAQALAGLQPGTATSSPILGTSTSDTAGAGTAATAAQQAAQNAYQQQAAQQLITRSLGN